jgi:sirohydrochlorin ferrochelatase
MRVARFVSSLVLTAHGSADPRSASTARAIADGVRRLRPSLDVRIAFCEKSFPNLRAVLPIVPIDSVVVPLLLADAYHARADIPVIIAESGTNTRQASVLGEDDRLIEVLRQRVEQYGVSRLDRDVGVLVAAVGSSRQGANARTESVARELTLTTRWTATTAFATGPRPGLDEAAELLRRRGAQHLIIAPWFLAPGKIIDRVAAFAGTKGIPVAAPLGAHHHVAAVVLDRFDQARATRFAA